MIPCTRAADGSTIALAHWAFATHRFRVFALACGSWLAACQHQVAPPEPGAAPAASQAAPAPGSAVPPPTAPAASAQEAPVPSASASSVPGAPEAATSATPPAGSAVPALFDAAGAPLPQVEERPTTTSPFFMGFGPALFAAIVADDPELVRPYFFPVVAYEQVKAIERPARDWETRLWRLFQRDIHEYHQELGRNRAAARFVAFEVPEDRAKLMKPGTEGNKLGYWRVLRAQLAYEDEAGRVRRLEVTSLISWRGEWYVVHLHGFQ